MDLERTLALVGLAAAIVGLFWFILRLQDHLDAKPNRRGEHDPWRGQDFDWTDRR